MQTSVPMNIAQSLPGMRGDIGVFDTMSRPADTAIPFGFLLVKGASAGSCKLPALITDLFVGIAEHQHYELAINTGAVQYASGDAVNVGRKGRYWVYTDQAVVIDDPVFMVCDTTGGGVAGHVRKDANTVSTVDHAVRINARFVTSQPTVGGLVEIDLIDVG